MKKRFYFFLPLILLAGCAYRPPIGIESGGEKVEGVRMELGGMKAKSLKSLVMLYARKGKIFLYSSQHTDSPIVEKPEIPFALQFRTVPVQSGFREAALFNGYMLEYCRGQLRKGLCPEHPGVPLESVPVGKERRGSADNVKEKRARLVCPRDKRSFELLEADDGGQRTSGAGGGQDIFKALQ